MPGNPHQQIMRPIAGTSLRAAPFTDSIGHFARPKFSPSRWRLSLPAKCWLLHWATKTERGDRPRPRINKRNIRSRLGQAIQLFPADLQESRTPLIPSPEKSDHECPTSTLSGAHPPSQTPGWQCRLRLSALGMWFNIRLAVHKYLPIGIARTGVSGQHVPYPTLKA